MGAFLIGLVSYIFMFYLFGFGGGMLIDMTNTEYKKMLKNSFLRPIIKKLIY